MSPEGDRQERHFRKSQTSLVPVFQQEEAGENIAKFVNIVMITRRESDIRFHYHTMYIKSPLRHSPKKWCSYPLSDSVHSIHKIILVNRQCT